MSAATKPTWDVRYHPTFQRYFLYVPAGADPVDGRPLTYATQLFPAEEILWQQGEIEELARQLLARGIPLPGARGQRESGWRRLLRALRRRLTG